MPDKVTVKVFTLTAWVKGAPKLHVTPEHAKQILDETGLLSFVEEAYDLQPDEVDETRVCFCRDRFVDAIQNNSFFSVCNYGAHDVRRTRSIEEGAFIEPGQSLQDACVEMVTEAFTAARSHLSAYSVFDDFFTVSVIALRSESAVCFMNYITNTTPEWFTRVVERAKQDLIQGL